mmetsp:Transcript_30123/g.64154  ORF Transcript_30123/g.64154 Transcript_30123/m.64154 type:complete len:284 (+) Transcript_30123:526-1377(+)
MPSMMASGLATSEVGSASRLGPMVLCMRVSGSRARLGVMDAFVIAMEMFTLDSGGKTWPTAWESTSIEMARPTRATSWTISRTAPASSDGPTSQSFAASSRRARRMARESTPGPTSLGTRVSGRATTSTASEATSEQTPVDSTGAGDRLPSTVAASTHGLISAPTLANMSWIKRMASAPSLGPTAAATRASGTKAACTASAATAKKVKPESRCGSESGPWARGPTGSMKTQLHHLLGRRLCRMITTNRWPLPEHERPALVYGGMSRAMGRKNYYDLSLRIQTP